MLRAAARDVLLRCDHAALPREAIRVEVSRRVARARRGAPRADAKGRRRLAAALGVDASGAGGAVFKGGLVEVVRRAPFILTWSGPESDHKDFWARGELGHCTRGLRT